MKIWPTAPIIRIIRGEYRDEPVEDVLAVRTSLGSGYVEAGGGYDFSRTRLGDYILEWEEMIAVPKKTLERFRQSFQGASVDSGLLEAALELISYGETAREEALKQAILTASIGAEAFPEDSSRDERVSAILGAVSAVFVEDENLVIKLARVAGLASLWADAEDPEADALADMRAKAVRLTEAYCEYERFSCLAQSAGAVADSTYHDKEYLREDLIHLGALSLIRATNIIQGVGK